MSSFNNLTLLPDDPILGLTIAFNKDPRPNKVNLGVGAYASAEGKPYVLNCVRTAEKLLLNENLDKEYLPLDGDKTYVKEILKLILGNNAETIQSNRVFGMQSVGGTASLRLGGELLVQTGIKSIYISSPTWPNHRGVFSKTALKVENYPYYDTHAHGFDFEAMCQAINEMPGGSAILLQAGCHNPTGLDPSKEQWKIISTLLQQKKIMPFFDIAYQGFSQDLDEDAWAIRYFIEQGHELLISYSCSKNFGLYGERVGLLAVVSNSSNNIQKLGSHLRTLARATYSTPPLQGARIVKTILTNFNLRKEWTSELENMRNRIQDMRDALAAGLQTHTEKRNFSFIKNQKGLFSFCGLNQDEVHRLKEEHGIHMPSNGRINIAGLNSQNIDYVIEAILSVI